VRTDICAREDIEAQTALLEALAAVGAVPDDDGLLESPLGVGLIRFTAPDGTITVFTDDWSVDLEGPDNLVRSVLAHMTGAS
jgi:hypothetical protein